MDALDDNQNQTASTFSFKWDQTFSYNDGGLRVLWESWLKEKYLGWNVGLLNDIFYRDKIDMLDAGCGAGISSLLLFGDYLKKANYLGVDISNSVEKAKMEFLRRSYNGQFLQTDLFQLEDRFNSYDLIFSEGVLHHTPSVRDGIQFLASRLTKNGFFLFYVYKKKAPIREWTDDFIRSQIADLQPDQAWKALESLTELGISLGDLNVKIEIKRDVPLLGISAGEYNLQRFFYYIFLKAFYNPSLTFAEMQHVNYDWFAPKYCWRHTPEEIEEFCSESGLNILHKFVDDSGISVVAKKM